MGYERGVTTKRLFLSAPRIDDLGPVRGISSMKIYLASRSPRRRQLLAQIGIDFELLDVAIDETWDGAEAPNEYVQRMAVEKAEAGVNKRPGNLPVLAADTCVVLDGSILGKADDDARARAMLRQLSGRRHVVYTAVTLIHQRAQTALSLSHVYFRRLSERDIDRYCNTGEPIGKAGAYAIQGQAAVFVKRLEGSHSGVMGLPLYDTSRLLESYRPGTRGCN